MPAPLDLTAVRRDFPILSREVNGKPLAYLDNAATTQKPASVIDAVSDFYREENANVHRGVHYLSMVATDLYDHARARVAKAIRAGDGGQAIFVRGTTEAINLVAATFGRAAVGQGDAVLITAMEHHANLVPWQRLCAERGAELLVAPVTDGGDLRMAEFERLVADPRVKIAAFAEVSNALGTRNDVVALCRAARAHGVATVVDGAQGVPHGIADVAAAGCDFYAFSGHKVFAPDGIGVLWGRRELLAAMEPYQVGGGIIERVTFTETRYQPPPVRFEAGTPNISGAIGLAAAFDYLDGIGWEAIRAHESALAEQAAAQIGAIPGARVIGQPAHRCGVVSFVLDGVHPHDIGTVLDSEGIAIRAGNHCAQPLLERLGVGSTARASFAFYNTFEEVERLTAAVRKAAAFFG